MHYDYNNTLAVKYGMLYAARRCTCANKGK